MSHEPKAFPCLCISKMLLRVFLLINYVHLTDIPGIDGQIGVFSADVTSGEFSVGTASEIVGGKRFSLRVRAAALVVFHLEHAHVVTF